MIQGLQQLMRYTRIQEIVGDVVRLQANHTANCSRALAFRPTPTCWCLVDWG